MKKKLVIGTLGAALVFGGAFAVSATNNDDISTTNKTKVEKTFLSTDEVEKIALQEVAGIVEEIELEKQAGKSVYEVDIEKDDIDYNLHIDAYSGEIYTIDRDDDDDNNYSHNGQNNQNIISQAMISIAKTIQLEEGMEKPAQPIGVDKPLMAQQD